MSILSLSLQMTILLCMQLFILSKPTNAESLPNTIYELNDSNIDYYISQSKYKWFVIFYLSTCSHCTRAREIMRKASQNVTDNLMRFGEIDINNNTLSSVRFKAAHVPYIVIIHNGKMHELTRFAGEKNIIGFINEEKKAEESVTLPAKIGYLNLFFIMFSSGIKTIFETIKGYLFKKDPFSNKYFAFAGVLGLILFVYFEYWLITHCWRKKESNDGLQSGDNKPNLKKE